MEWLTTIKKAISYIEDNIKTIDSVDDVAKECFISSLYLQQGFQVMTGYSIGEYIRNRKLYEASIGLMNGEKVIDIAMKYGYQTPESFSKAFQRFHGFLPSKIKENKNNIHKFLPIHINISVSGGNIVEMDYKVKKIESFKVIGFVREFNSETSYQEIPMFWDDVANKYMGVYTTKNPSNDYERAVLKYSIGEFGICCCEKGNDFKYIIGGRYDGGDVPDGMIVYEFKECDWAIFDSYGPCPTALQSLNTKIFKEWLPGNLEYEITGDFSVEWYDPMCMDTSAMDYHTQIWIPIKKIK